MFKLHPDERVILYVRRHWIFLALEALFISILFLAPVLLIWIVQINNYLSNLNLFDLSFLAFTNVFIYLWALFCWMLLAERFTDYALDFWVVTNKRIIESELIKLFDVQLSTLELQDIEDITVRSAGFLASIIGFGRLDVQTAGAVNEFFANNIMNPAEVQRIIFEAKLAHQKEEKDIEKVEMEQISRRIVSEKVDEVTHSKTDNELSEELKQLENEIKEREIKSEIPKNDFDWAHIDEKQSLESRNETEEIDEISSKFKRDFEKAIRVE